MTCLGYGRPFYPFGPPIPDEVKRSIAEMRISAPHGGYVSLTPREVEVLKRCGECMKIWDEGQRLEEARLAAEKVKQEKEGRILGVRIALGMVALFYLWQFLKRN